MALQFKKKIPEVAALGDENSPTGLPSSGPLSSEAYDNSSLQELETVIPYENGFVFSKFAEFTESDSSLQELPPDSIIQGEDGVFSISPDINYTDIVQDGDFRKLVESVLKA